jgi:ABC-2 type transport system ATP-binding protein
VRVHHLSPSRASLEQAFMELTAGSVEYHAGLPETRQPAHIEMEN